MTSILQLIKISVCLSAPPVKCDYHAGVIHSDTGSH